MEGWRETHEGEAGCHSAPIVYQGSHEDREGGLYGPIHHRGDGEGAVELWRCGIGLKVSHGIEVELAGCLGSGIRIARRVIRRTTGRESVAYFRAGRMTRDECKGRAKVAWLSADRVFIQRSGARMSASSRVCFSASSGRIRLPLCVASLRLLRPGAHGNHPRVRRVAFSRRFCIECSTDCLENRWLIAAFRHVG
ncbi:hypothetical protein NYA28ABAC_01301 [Salinicola sp. NYA28a]